MHYEKCTYNILNIYSEILELEDMSIIDKIISDLQLLNPIEQISFSSIKLQHLVI